MCCEGWRFSWVLVFAVKPYSCVSFLGIVVIWKCIPGWLQGRAGNKSKKKICERTVTGLLLGLSRMVGLEYRCDRIRLIMQDLGVQDSLCPYVAEDIRRRFDNSRQLSQKAFSDLAAQKGAMLCPWQVNSFQPTAFFAVILWLFSSFLSSKMAWFSL